jgi:hypothetical protein
MSAVWQPYDSESREEVNRLLVRERVLNELLRGPLPPGLDLPAEAQVLHIACGPGTWIYLLVLNHPSLQVTGIDKSTYFLQCARHYLAGLDNIALLEHDIRTERGFLPARTFDLVHMRFLAAELSPTVLPEVITDVVKSCKHGAHLWWTECEFPTTNSRPCEQLLSYILHGLAVCGRCYAPGCNTLGITAYMSQWLHGAGCRVVQNQAYALDISAGMPAQQAFVQQARVLSQQLRPLVTKAGVVSSEVYDAVTVQALEQMHDANFCGVLFMRSMIATVP